MTELMTEQEFDRFIKNAALLLSVSNLNNEIKLDEMESKWNAKRAEMEATFADFDKRITELETILNVKPRTKAIKRPWQYEK